ncbi:hypothetical protein AB0F72_25680 [Actinoplanes sp. NPDC023936]|uniref:hypothetical protein n=1 Tax=Actinoplanes sp. NPDC023936 TaxID=3154910 RepID=UPI0033F08B6B
MCGRLRRLTVQTAVMALLATGLALAVTGPGRAAVAGGRDGDSPDGISGTDAGDAYCATGLRPDQLAGPHWNAFHGG